MSVHGPLGWRLSDRIRKVYRAVGRSPAAPLLRVSAIRHVRDWVTPPARVEVVLATIDALEAEELRAHLIGGWGCDALVGGVTRPHSDLDLLLDNADHQSAVRVLEKRGLEPTQQWTPIWMDTAVRMLDRRSSVTVHSADLSSPAWSGPIRERMAELGYPPEEILASGSIEGREVSCLGPVAQLVFHTGYPPIDKDRSDVALICARFGLDPPPEYRSA